MRGSLLLNINKSIVLAYVWKGYRYTTTLAMRMMLGSLREVDPNKESVEDFDEHFEFYYVAKVTMQQRKGRCL